MKTIDQIVEDKLEIDLKIAEKYLELSKPKNTEDWQYQANFLKVEIATLTELSNNLKQKIEYIAACK